MHCAEWEHRDQQCLRERGKQRDLIVGGKRNISSGEEQRKKVEGLESKVRWRAHVAAVSFQIHVMYSYLRLLVSIKVFSISEVFGVVCPLVRIIVVCPNYESDSLLFEVSSSGSKAKDL